MFFGRFLTFTKIFSFRVLKNGGKMVLLTSIQIYKSLVENLSIVGDATAQRHSVRTQNTQGGEVLEQELNEYSCVKTADILSNMSEDSSLDQISDGRETQTESWTSDIDQTSSSYPSENNSDTNGVHCLQQEGCGAVEKDMDKQQSQWTTIFSLMANYPLRLGETEAVIMVLQKKMTLKCNGYEVFILIFTCLQITYLI